MSGSTVSSGGGGYASRLHFRSSTGCCICGTKSSSSRFTASSRFSQNFVNCFGPRAENRSGDLCNACVLCLKRWVGLKKALGACEKVLDSKKGPGPKHMKEISKRNRRREALLQNSNSGDSSSGANSRQPSPPPLQHPSRKRAKTPKLASAPQVVTSSTVGRRSSPDLQSTPLTSVGRTASNRFPPPAPPTNNLRSSSTSGKRRDDSTTPSSFNGGHSPVDVASSQLPAGDWQESACRSRQHSTSWSVGPAVTRSASARRENQLAAIRQSCGGRGGDSTCLDCASHLPLPIDGCRCQAAGCLAVRHDRRRTSSQRLPGQAALSLVCCSCCLMSNDDTRLCSCPIVVNCHVSSGDSNVRTGPGTSSAGVNRDSSLNSTNMSSDTESVGSQSLSRSDGQLRRYNRRVILPPVKMLNTDETDRLLRKIMENNSQAVNFDSREMHMAVQHELRGRTRRAANRGSQSTSLRSTSPSLLPSSSDRASSISSLDGCCPLVDLPSSNNRSNRKASNNYVCSCSVSTRSNNNVGGRL